MEVVRETSTDLKRYGLQHTWGDAYAGVWPRAQYRNAASNTSITDKSKSDLYRELLPAMNSGLVELSTIPGSSRNCATWSGRSHGAAGRLIIPRADTMTSSTPPPLRSSWRSGAPNVPAFGIVQTDYAAR